MHNGVQKPRRLLFGIHIRSPSQRFSWVNFLPANGWAVDCVSPRAGPPTAEYEHCSFFFPFAFKNHFLQRKPCCLLCLMFWMLLTSVSATLILCATFSMIEFISLQMLMGSKGPVHTPLQTRTRGHKHAHTHARGVEHSQDRALSVDELS